MSSNNERRKRMQHIPPKPRYISRTPRLNIHRKIQAEPEIPQSMFLNRNAIIGHIALHESV